MELTEWDGMCAVTGWESAGSEELEGTVGLVALDVLRITSRSRHNRALLLHLGVLPGLARLMKVGCAFWGPLSKIIAVSSAGRLTFMQNRVIRHEQVQRGMGPFWHIHL